jgi:hypothetical protein
VVDYELLRTNNWKKLPEPDSEPEQEQEAQQPAIDLVWNVHQEDGHATTIALRLTIRLPLHT